MKTPKPCPFCGDEPEIVPSDPKREGSAWAAVQCNNPNCVTFDTRFERGVRVEDGETISDDRGSDGYKQAAIKRWNVRAVEQIGGEK